MTITIDLLGGNCPVQAEGTVDGEPFYFRARGERWSMEIGGALPAGDRAWSYTQRYGTEKYAAGWMSEAEATTFIGEAVKRWREETSEKTT